LPAGVSGVFGATLVAWPLIVDPVRETIPLAARLRLAAALLFVRPARIAVLGLAVAVATVISTVLTAAILTVSVSFIALVACRVVLPAADRLDPMPGGERA
jgi:uncharacterized membrane protein YesL